MDCWLLPCQRHHTPKFCGENVCEWSQKPQNLRKFSPLKFPTIRYREYLTHLCSAVIEWYNVPRCALWSYVGRMAHGSFVPPYRSEYVFNFDNTFELHNDIDVLKKMGLDCGLHSGACSSEDLKNAKSMLPKAFESTLDGKHMR